MMLYRFDKKLRLLIFNEIEKIEVAVRSAIVNIGSKMTGNPFWMTDCANFTNQAWFSKTLKLIEDEYSHSREDFILHFKETYSNPYSPSWILSEILPFGVMTNIKDKKIKKRIAQSFGLQAIPFESWLTIVALTRNSCCHHARVWNKQNTIRPTMPNVVPLPWITLRSDPLRIYFNLCIIKYFLNTISPGNDMKEKVQTLLTSFSEVDVSAMGYNIWRFKDNIVSLHRRFPPRFPLAQRIRVGLLLSATRYLPRTQPQRILNVLYNEDYGYKRKNKAKHRDIQCLREAA